MNPSPTGKGPGGSAPRLGLPLRVGVVWSSLVVVWAAVSLFRHQALGPDASYEARRVVEAVLAGGVGVLVVVAARRWLDRRSLASLAFGWARRDRLALLAGAGLWLGLAAVGLVVGAALGWFDVTFASPTWTWAGWLLVQAALVLCAEAVPEELAFRGYLCTNLAERWPRWLAVTAQAVLFTLWAFAYVGLLQLLGLPSGWSISLDRTILFLTFGLALAIVRLWTGSLWGSIGFHWAFQTVMQLLWLDRLTVVRIAPEQLGTASVVLWFFGIVVGGVVALVGVARNERRRTRGPGPP